MKPKTKRMSKKQQALSIARVHCGIYNATDERILAAFGGLAGLYRSVARMGYYWNMAKQDWQSVRLTLTHVQSCASLFQHEDKYSTEYLQRLVDGGILRRKKDGSYKRTAKIELPAEFGNFNYGR